MLRFQNLVEKYGIPGRDLYELPSSDIKFPDGAHYRNEISGIESLADMEALIDEMNKRQVPIHRVITMGCGTNLLTFTELQELSRMGKEVQIELIVIPGPRANFDIGKHAASDWGKFSGIRPRGSDHISYFIEDVYRCIEAGIRGFLFYGEDILNLMNMMRENGDLPKDLVFKLSYTAGVANAAGCKLAKSVGADSINPVTDLTLPMLASLRKTVETPLDIVVVTFEILGDFKRFWETGEIIRVSSPCYIKQELTLGEENARTKVKYCEIIREIVTKQNPELVLSEMGPSDLRLPKP
jgi:hypothetical protein